MKIKNPQQVLEELEKMATNLGERNCPYLAALVLQYYDGECAAETKEARMISARKYLDMARAQPPYEPAPKPKA